MVTTTKARPTSMRHHLALAILKARRQWYAEYDEAVEAWFRDSETRKYRYPECIHGMSRWTDYDNICGPCEDGYGHFHYLTELRDAWEEAGAREGRMRGRVDALWSLRDQGAPKEACKSIMSWIWDELSKGTDLFKEK